MERTGSKSTGNILKGNLIKRYVHWGIHYHTFGLPLLMYPDPINISPEQDDELLLFGGKA